MTDCQTVGLMKIRSHDVEQAQSAAAADLGEDWALFSRLRLRGGFCLLESINLFGQPPQSVAFYFGGIA